MYYEMRPFREIQGQECCPSTLYVPLCMAVNTGQFPWRRRRDLKWQRDIVLRADAENNMDVSSEFLVSGVIIIHTILIRTIVLIFVVAITTIQISSGIYRS